MIFYIIIFLDCKTADVRGNSSLVIDKKVRPGFNQGECFSASLGFRNHRGPLNKTTAKIQHLVGQSGTQTYILIERYIAVCLMNFPSIPFSVYFSLSSFGPFN